MNAENIGSRNLGDLSLWDGEKREKIERKNVLILGTKAVTLNPTKFDEIVPLSGCTSVDEDENEKQVLAETTINDY